MAKLLVAFLVLTASFSFGGSDDSIFSVFFSAKSKPGTSKVAIIPTQFHNRYTLKETEENKLRMAAGDNLIADKSGLYLEKHNLLSITREEIRENSKYHIHNGYLYGVVKNDSLMVKLEGDSYYFLIPKKTYLYEAGNKITKLYKGMNANEFIVLSKEENGYLSALYVSFSPGKISLKELDFEQKELDFRTITHKKISENDIPLYLLNPSKSEWQNLMRHFMIYDEYIVETKLN